MEALARKILKRPLEIVVGGRSVVASEIEQIIEVREADTKFNRLLEILGRMYFEDKDARTLVFVDRQESADNLLGDLQKRGYTCMSLHGGKDQVDRDETISDFKSGACPIVIATSVAARGLDVKQLKLVVNYDAPNHLEDYVHRAGRTGRAGNKGTCITFVEPDQDKYAVDLVRALKDSKVAVPEDLQKMSDEFLAKVKGGKATATGSGFGGKGLDRFEKDRDNKEKAQRSAYGESTAEDKKETERATAAAADEAGGGEAAAAAEAEYDYDIEIRHGPAPDSSRRGATMTRPSAGNLVSAQAVRAAEEAARKNGTVLTAVQRAQIVAQALAGSLGKVPAPQTGFDYRQETLAQARVRDPDATEYHAIVPANDVRLGAPPGRADLTRSSRPRSAGASRTRRRPRSSSRRTAAPSRSRASTTRCVGAIWSLLTFAAGQGADGRRSAQASSAARGASSARADSLTRCSRTSGRSSRAQSSRSSASSSKPASPRSRPKTNRRATLAAVDGTRSDLRHCTLFLARSGTCPRSSAAVTRCGPQLGDAGSSRRGSLLSASRTSPSVCPSLTIGHLEPRALVRGLGQLDVSSTHAPVADRPYTSAHFRTDIRIARTPAARRTSPRTMAAPVTPTRVSLATPAATPPPPLPHSQTAVELSALTDKPATGALAPHRAALPGEVGALTAAQSDMLATLRTRLRDEGLEAQLPDFLATPEALCRYCRARNWQLEPTLKYVAERRDLG